MKLLIFLIVLLATGCAHRSSLPAATLEFNPQVDGSIDGGGIWAIDDELFARPAAIVEVRAGKRTVGYACPGTLFVDWPSTVRYRFGAGRAYVMRCEADKPVISARWPVAA